MKQDEYEFSIDDCDVENKELLQEFREKRSQWIQWLTGHDVHSIWRQLNYNLFWNHAFFCTVNTLSKRTARDHPDELVNGYLLSLFDTGFVVSQATTIRRLVDKPGSGDKKSVNSLRRLIQDIKDHRHLVTRENYVSFDGLPYEPEPANQRHIEEMLSKPPEERSGFLPTTGPEAFMSSETKHECFDRISEGAKDGPTRTELISSRWFSLLLQHLTPCDDVNTFVHKFIAHAADPENRKELQGRQASITIKSLEACYKALYVVTSFIYGYLLHEGTYLALPVPQLDHLKNIDKPLVAPERIRDAHIAWDSEVGKFEKLSGLDLFALIDDA